MASAPKWDDTTPASSATPTTNDTPKWEETTPMTPHHYSQVESGLIGAAQGATLNFGDEAFGALKALAAAPFKAAKKLNDEGDYSPSKVAKTAADALEEEYTTARDKIRDITKEAKKQNPYSYGAGEIAGGFAIPGLGNVGKLYKAAEVLSPVARIAARLGIGAASGGAIGGLSAAGASEAGTPEEVAQDTLQGAEKGAETGGLLSGGTQALGGLAGYAGNKLVGLGENSKFIRTLTKPFTKGLQGTDLSAPVQEEAATGLAKRLGTGFTDLKKDLQDQYTHFINEAEANGNSIDLKDAGQKILDDANEAMETATPEEKEAIKQVVGNVNKYIQQPTSSGDMGGLVTPEEGNTSISASKAKELETTLGELKKSQGRMGVGQFANQADQSISGELADQIPGIADTNKDYANMSNAFDALGIKKGLNNVNYGSEENAALPNSPYNKILSIIRNQGADSTSTAGQKTRYQLENAINALKETSPELADKLQNELPQVSENYNLSKDLEGTSPYSSAHLKGLVVGNLVKGGGLLGNKAGLALNQNADALSSGAGRGLLSSIAEQAQPKEVSQQAYNMSNDSLKNLVSSLSSTPHFEGQAQALQNALDGKNEVAKNAVLFNLLQTPDGRGVLRNHMQ